MSLTLPDPNKVPGDANHTSDTNLIIEAINTLKSEVDGIPAGPTGAKGDPGTPGAAGTPATVTVGSTNTSAPGGNAAVTNSGTASNAIFDFTIPRGAGGPKGDTGPQGPIGPKGDDGDNAAISIGTVTDTAPGGSPAVTNSGTTLNAVLDFILPRGTQGPQGIQGPKGDQGDSINVKESVATVGDLPPTGNSPGDARVVLATGDLYVWDGSTWNNVGTFQGPQGEQGYKAHKGFRENLSLTLTVDSRILTMVV
jgi:hypothetical protein